MTAGRRHVLIGGTVGLFSMLTGCGFLRPGMGAVNDAIEDAPGVVRSDLSRGPGGGLGEGLMGTITFDVPPEELPDSLDAAWGRGVEVIHRMDDGERGIPVNGVHGVTGDGTTVHVEELVDIGSSTGPVMGHFYDHYGIT